jgi:hypothetical protein
MQIGMRRIRAVVKRRLHRDVWPIDERAATPPINWNGWPEGKKFAFVLTHDVESAHGHEKCRQLARVDLDSGFISCFNFTPERYDFSPVLRKELVGKGFEVGVHGLYHDGMYFFSRMDWKKRARRINQYLSEWGSVGFRAPSMLHNLEWILDLDIEHDSSTFDTDPFEPQCDGAGTIFPFRVSPSGGGQRGYVELPYTLPQDFTLFTMLGETGPSLWKVKLRWLAEKGGMALMITHPDYMNFNGRSRTGYQYPVEYYIEFLEHVRTEYAGQYWNALPRDVARYFRATLW